MSTRRQAGRFGIAGCCAVATDFSFYSLFLILGLPTAISKGVSFLSGTAVAYFLNKRFTFQSNQKNMKEPAKFLFLYGLTLCINVGANAAILQTLGSHAKLIGFLGATSISMTLNFIGQKFWVFVDQTSVKKS